MSITQSSYRSPSGVAASVQKRRTLYLAASDPRVKSKDTITRYQNDYYAEIVILSDEEYLKLLSNQIGIQQDNAIVADSVAVGTVLHPPTNLYWDYPNDTEFVTINGNNEVNIIVTFDSGDVEYPGLKYTYVINGANSGIVGTSLGAETLLDIDPTTFHVQTYTSSEITITWRGYTDALGYNVTAVGNNLPPFYEGQTLYYSQSLNSLPANSYYVDYTPGHKQLDSNGKASITLKPLSPTMSPFSGFYFFTIYPQYTKNAGKLRPTLEFNVSDHNIPIKLDGAVFANA